jgi:hypothetical protein
MKASFRPLKDTPKATLWAAVCVTTLSCPLVVQAETAPNDWAWNATLYLWLPSMEGETAFPPSGGGPSIDITADQVLDSLNLVFMGAIEGSKGPWGLATDLVYIDFGASKKGTRDFGIGHVDIPATVNADLHLDVTGWLWTLTGSHALIDHDKLTLNALAGARMLDLREHLGWALNGDLSSLPIIEREGSSSASKTQWDAIVGVKGRAMFGAKRSWYVPYYLDVGTGESNFTWQGVVGLGYSFGSVDVLGAWRYVDYDLGDNTPIKSLNFNGPAVGVTFHF